MIEMHKIVNVIGIAMIVIGVAFLVITVAQAIALVR